MSTRTPSDSGQDQPTSGAAGRAGLATAAVFLVALCLRPPITAVGPLLPQIGEHYALSESAQGVLGAIPLLAFGAVSPFVHRLARRRGLETTILAALILLAAAIAVRSWTGVWGLWIGTFFIGAGIAIGNVLVPVVVRRDFPKNIAQATGGYSACITMAAAVASAIAVPIAAASDWQASLGIWGAFVLLIAALWAPRLRRRNTAVTEQQQQETGSIWREPTAWWVTAFMGLQSTLFYTLITWLPTIEISHGTSAQTAGIRLFVLHGLGLISGLTIPIVLRKTADERLGMVVASVPMALAVTGLLLWPAMMLVWVVLAGIGQGASLVAALTLVSLRGRTQQEAAKLSGMAQSVGYLLAMLGPIGAGYLADITGSWQPSLALCLVLACIQIPVALRAGVDRRSAPLPDSNRR